ncbi:MAG: response regulator transcription factor [Bacteroidales bacterium]|nr:response regulator transcription factor [Bacteroidales bacterium]
MRCICVDDEPLALNIIEDFVNKIPFLSLEAKCTNAFEAIKIMQEQKIDLIYLDIQMPHITGLEFVKTLKNPPMVIFTTAYSNHALDGFDLNAVDYLVKPISFERFFKSANKANELYHLRKNQGNTKNKNTEKSVPDYLMIKVEYSTVKVNLEDILFVEGLKDYVKIFLPHETLLTKTTMKNMEEKLPSDRFIRVHKSFIISIQKIERIENNRIVIFKKLIPIGKQYKDEFYEHLSHFRL